MRAFFTSDLHLTSRSQDEYRWDIFDWLKINAERREVDTIFLLGDLTDAKDGHASRLVNRLIEALKDLTSVADLHILKGNHDYIDQANPFFKFLREVSKIHYYNEPRPTTLQGYDCLFLPHTTHFRRQWADFDFRLYDFVFFHQALSGSISSTGYQLPEGDGFPPSLFDDAKRYVIGGDIHVPQEVGNAVYCGAPHPVHFGDVYSPRVLFFNGEELRSIRRACIKKHSITIREVKDLEQHTIDEGDRVRIVVELPRHEFGSWKEWKAEVKAYVEERQAELYGLELRELVTKRKTLHSRPTDGDGRLLTPEDLLKSFCLQEALPQELAFVGCDLVRDALRRRAGRSSQEPL